MTKKFITGAILLFCVTLFTTSQAQNASLNEYLNWYDSTQHNKDVQRAIDLGLPLTIQSESGFAEFQYFGLNNFPIYYVNHNLEAAKTISTNKLWTGGSLGLNLDGDSMIIGIWDGGKVRDTHVELTGRVSQKDAASTLSEHATHVSGTLIGKGVKAAAKGMSWKADLWAYDWTLDEIEMDQAATNGLLISNHSYGIISGWYNNTSKSRWEWYGDTSISATEDWRYGFYDQQARDWDKIAVDHPNYLIVKSAGNDRGDKLPATEDSHWVFNSSTGAFVLSTTARPSDGPYDCINGAGVAKNVLTVGAVNSIANGYSQSSDVVMSSFSGWGPTDDGRIKPDVVGNGVGVNSSVSSSDNAYKTLNGTSMASPNVAGSLLLWQEHFKHLFSTQMRAATLKGLAIHTADEAGNADGPDYRFGWGLVNSASAITLINEMGEFSELMENSLSNGGSYELIIYNDGTEPLKSTISWTDPVASISSASLDPTDKKLINDLDIRIYRISDNQEFQPWVLDPANPSDNATTGDNSRDNVEQVYLANPQAGFYKIVVNHKSTLQSNAAQLYSLIVSGVKPKLEATYNAPTQNVCTFNPIVFDGESLGDVSDYEWTFTGLDTVSATGKYPEVIFEKQGSYTVKLKVSNQFTSDSIEMPSALTVWPSPTNTVTPLSGLFCSNDSIPHALSGSAGNVYSGDGVSDSSFIPRDAGSGTHRIYGQLTDQLGCYARDSFDVTVEKAPGVPLIVIDNGDLVSSFTSNNTWYVHGQSIPGANAQRYTPVQSGLYFVEVTNTAGCVTRSGSYYYFMDNFIDPDFSTFSIYPNPSHGQFSISLEEISENIEIKLFDLQGKEVYKNEYQKTKLFDVNTDNLKDGVYLIQLKLNSGEILNRLIQIRN